MRFVIDISEYDKEWIGNACGIPQDINTKIAEAIINAELCQPEPHYDEWCDSCQEYDHNKHCCPRWNKVIKNTVEELKAAQLESYWIPVTERLPEESGLYQVTDMQGHVVRYVFNANESSIEYWRRCVKAWMPLPESYKGD